MAIDFIGFGATHPDPSEMVSTEDLFKMLSEKAVIVDKEGLARMTEKVGMKWHWKTDRTSSELALIAAREACDNAAKNDPDFAISKIGLVISGGSSIGCLYPATAAQIQDQLGIPDWCCRVIEISNACASWTQGVITAYDAMRSGDVPCGNRVDYALVAVGEVPFSRMNTPDSLNFCLWDNNGGAGVVRNDHINNCWDRGILGTLSGSCGKYADVAEGTIGTDFLPCWWEVDWPTPRKTPNAKLNDGKALAHQLMVNTPPIVEKLLGSLGLMADDSTTFAGHDANLWMYNIMAEALGIAPENRLTMLGENNRSNGSSSSIPSKLEYFTRMGRFKPGDLTIIAGYAAGLLIDAIAYRW